VAYNATVVVDGRLGSGGNEGLTSAHGSHRIEECCKKKCYKHLVLS